MSRLSLVEVSGGYSLFWRTVFSLQRLLLLQSSGCRHAGSRLQAQKLWCTGLVTPQHVGSTLTGIKPMSPVLAGGFLTTGPPGKLYQLKVLLTRKE